MRWKEMREYLFWTIKFIFLNATYCISDSVDSKVTNGGANLRCNVWIISEVGSSISINFIRTLTVDNTTAAFACAKRGVTLSQMLWD